VRPCVPFQVLLYLAIPALGAGTLVAQAVVTGAVRDDSTGRPIEGAEVLIEALGRRTSTDLSGRFLLDGLPPGLRVLLVRRIGYHPVSVMVQISGRDTARVDIVLEPMIVELAPLVVTEAPPRPPRGIGREAFEERRRMGFGAFLDSVTLRRSEHLRVDDVLRRHTRVRLSTILVAGEERLVALSPRMPGRDGRLCFLQVWLDGLLFFRGGLMSPRDPEAEAKIPDLRSFVDVGSLELVEVYYGAAGTPVEFGGHTAQCGTIVLWTRAGGG
jgi:hypothetical protein